MLRYRNAVFACEKACYVESWCGCVMKPMRRIEDSLSKMRALGSRLSVLFLVLFVALCASSAVLIVLEVLSYISTATAPDPYVVFQFISSMLMSVVYGVMLLVMRGVAKDVSRGRSPFTFSHARHIKIIAWMFVVSFALNLFISPDFIEMIHVGNADIGLVSDQVRRYLTIHLDVKSVVGAVVCFSLSSVWKYGALLQADSDDYL